MLNESQLQLVSAVKESMVFAGLDGFKSVLFARELSRKMAAEDQAAELEAAILGFQDRARVKFKNY